MTAYQKELASELQSILAGGPKNTHQIAVARGDRQVYETHLRDRLFRLEERGILKSEWGPSRGCATARLWSLA